MLYFDSHNLVNFILKRALPSLKLSMPSWCTFFFLMQQTTFVGKIRFYGKQFSSILYNRVTWVVNGQRKFLKADWHENVLLSISQ